MPLTCGYHSTVERVETLVADLPGGADALADPDDPFLRLAWFRELHRSCLPERKPLLGLAVDGADAAVLALVEAGQGEAAALANYYSFHFAPVFAPNMARAAEDRLLAALAKELSAHANRAVLAPVPEADGLAERVAAAFRRAGWRVFAEPCDTNHVVRLAGRDFAQYWADRPGQLRSTVKRKGKKGLVDCRILTEFDDAAWDDYEAIYRASWKPAERFPDFLRAWARSEGAAGRLRLGIAIMDAKPVAAQFWTVDHCAAFIHKLAHLPDTEKASPGTLLSAALFEHVIDRDGVDFIDFGTGDDGYKRDWMEETRTSLRLACYRPLVPRNAVPIARKLAKKALLGLAAPASSD